MNGGQTIDMVKRVIVDLVSIHNSKVRIGKKNDNRDASKADCGYGPIIFPREEIPLDKIFLPKDLQEADTYEETKKSGFYEYLFKEPTIAQYTIYGDYWPLDQGDEKREKRTKALHNDCFCWRHAKILRELFHGSIHTEEVAKELKMLEKAEKMAFAWTKNNPAPDFCSSDRGPWDRHQEKQRKAFNIIYKDLYRDAYCSYGRIIRALCEENDIDYRALGRSVYESGSLGPSVSFPKADKSAKGFLEALENAFCYEYNMVKGRTILLESASDNSVPYQMFEDIKNMFSGVERRHLG